MKWPIQNQLSSLSRRSMKKQGTSQISSFFIFQNFVLCYNADYYLPIMDLLKDQEAFAGYFADCLIEAKYVSGLDEAGYETIRQELIELINREISQVIFDNLTADQLEDMERMLDEEDAEGMTAFLRAAIPDLRDLILRRLVDIKNEMQ